MRRRRLDWTDVLPEWLRVRGRRRRILAVLAARHRDQRPAHPLPLGGDTRADHVDGRAEWHMRRRVPAGLSARGAGLDAQALRMRTRRRERDRRQRRTRLQRSRLAATGRHRRRRHCPRDLLSRRAPGLLRRHPRRRHPLLADAHRHHRRRPDVRRLDASDDHHRWVLRTSLWPRPRHAQPRRRVRRRPRPLRCDPLLSTHPPTSGTPSLSCCRACSLPSMLCPFALSFCSPRGRSIEPHAPQPSSARLLSWPAAARSASS